MIKIYAPATIGNIGVGFDVLGAAVLPIDGILFGDCVSVESSKDFYLENKGPFIESLPALSEENIVYQCWKYFCRAIKKTIPVTMILEKNIPIGSGMGSSASSIVAALIAMNEYCSKPLDNIKLLLLMGELEGMISGSVHYDNVAPCFLGNVQLIVNEAGIISQNLPFLEDCFWVLAYPGVKLSTAEARIVLPAKYPREDCIKHARLLAGFVHACHTKQFSLAAKMMQDVIAEPYRIKLLPGFLKIRNAVLNLGALACGISGSGPTLFALCHKMFVVKEIVDYLTQYYIQNDVGFIRICRLDTIGVRKLG